MHVLNALLLIMQHPSACMSLMGWAVTPTELNVVTMTFKTGGGITLNPHIPLTDSGNTRCILLQSFPHSHTSESVMHNELSPK